MKDVEDLLRKTAFRRIDVEQVLNLKIPSWIRFDPELGYVPAPVRLKDGDAGMWSTYTYDRPGNRKTIQYRDRPCRITSFGDSFTQCQQVSDGETWQEYLAANLGEPVRNFGSGGYGLYQATLRARRMDEAGHGEDHLLLGIYDDDHVRSLDAARWIRTFAEAPPPPPRRAIHLHGLPWAHLRLDPKTGKFQGHPGICRTASDLKALTDQSKFVAAFRNDEIVRLFALQMGLDIGDVSPFEKLAGQLGAKVDLRNPATRRKDARLLRIAYGLAATEFALDDMLRWIRRARRKLFVLLSYGEGRIADAIAGKPRFDGSLLAYLDRNGVPYADLLEAHVRDYSAFKGPVEEYLARYFINPAGTAVFGHYKPAGNHFAAMAIRDALVKSLKPAPPACRP